MTSLRQDAAKILVVDDEINIREALAALLQGDGHRVSAAASLEQALEYLQSWYQRAGG